MSADEGGVEAFEASGGDNLIAGVAVASRLAVNDVHVELKPHAEVGAIKEREQSGTVL